MSKVLKPGSVMTIKKYKNHSQEQSNTSKRKLNKRQRKLNKKKTEDNITKKVKTKQEINKPSQFTIKAEEKSKDIYESRHTKVKSSSKKRKPEESKSTIIENTKKLKTVYEVKSPEDYSANWKQLKKLLSTGSNKKNTTSKQKIQKEKIAPAISKLQSENSKDHEVWFDDVDPSLLEDNVKINSVSPGENTIEETETNNSFTGLTKIVALDCEMVGGGVKGEMNLLARVSLVNFHGNVIYDKYVKPQEPVKDYRTKVSGIRHKDIADGELYNVVQKEVSDILQNRILVGHALGNDLSCLMIHHPTFRIRDTSKYTPFTKLYGKRPSLKKLAEKVLGATIQSGEHDSVEDARAAMQLYALNRKVWEMEHVQRKKKKQEPQKKPQSEDSDI